MRTQWRRFKNIGPLWGALLVASCGAGGASQKTLTSSTVIPTTTESESVLELCQPGKPQLVNCDFSGRDLRDADFSDSNVSFANFSNTDLSGANFSRAIAQGANFTGANVRGTRWELANISQADFRSSIGLFGAGFDRVNAVEAKFVGAQTIPDDYENKVRWEGSDFSRADLSGLALDSWSCAGCIFVDTKMTGMRLAGSGFGSDQPGQPTIFRRVDFSGSFFWGVSFSGAVIEDSNFSDVRVPYSSPVSDESSRGSCEGDWSGPQYLWISFDSATIANSRFTRAELSCSTFRKAILKNVSFLAARWIVSGGVPGQFVNGSTSPKFSNFLNQQAELICGVTGVSGELLEDGFYC